MAGGPGFRSPLFFGLAGAFQPIPPPPLVHWTLGALWQLSTLCANIGVYGIRRTADGVTGSSDVTSTSPFSVTPGITLFTSFFSNSSGGADGQMGFGFAFYDSSSSLISTLFIETVGSPPTSWTQTVGNITVPNFAATAVPIVRSFNHLHGTWCVDSVSAITSGGNFVLSALRHYYSEYQKYRNA